MFLDLVLILGIISLNVTSCNSANPGNSGNTIIVENCNLSTELYPGDTVVVKLIQYPGRGYSWILKEKPSAQSGIIFLSESYVDNQNTLDDGSQAILYHFLLKFHGNFLLEFEYIRPWENETSQNCKLRVIVQ